jgi:hypothetical protein
VFQTPTATKARDTLIAILATADTNDGPDLTDLDGWIEEAAFTFAATSSKVWVLRREAQIGDTSTVEIPFLDATAWGLGVLAVWRNLNTGSDVVASGSTAVAASTNFPCPTLALTTYSDLYVGIALVTSAATAVAPPAGGTELAELQSGGRTLEVFQRLPEAVGATGAQTATTGANQSGGAAAIALAADPIIGFGKSFAFDPVGAIGLPSEGV